MVNNRLQPACKILSYIWKHVSANTSLFVFPSILVLIQDFILFYIEKCFNNITSVNLVFIIYISILYIYYISTTVKFSFLFCAPELITKETERWSIHGRTSTLSFQIMCNFMFTIWSLVENTLLLRYKLSYFILFWSQWLSNSVWGWGLGGRMQEPAQLTEISCSNRFNLMSLTQWEKYVVG